MRAKKQTLMLTVLVAGSIAVSRAAPIPAVVAQAVAVVIMHLYWI